jgi:transposase InsO family protein
MIRKQLYITADQEQALKQRAGELGMSEAELVRRALDQVLKSGSGSDPRAGLRQRAAEELLRHADEVARTRPSGGQRRWRRADLYAERLRRSDDVDG